LASFEHEHRQGAALEARTVLAEVLLEEGKTADARQERIAPRRPGPVHNSLPA